MSALSTDDLARLRDSITPGSWFLEGNWSAGSEMGGWLSCGAPDTAHSPLFGLDPICGSPEQIIANARAIALLPDLLSELTHLRGEVEAMRAVAETALAAPTTGESHGSK